jgi:RNA polymerase sigma factor (sigma-70 family)
MAGMSRKATMASLSKSRRHDSVLISGARQGDEDALNELFSRYNSFLHFLACRVLGGREDAQDVVQNCLLRAFRNLEQFNNDGAFRSWLARILVNEAISFLRKKRSRLGFSVERVSREDDRDVLDRLPGPGLNPEQAMAKKESILSLSKEVDRLSTPLRSVVILCDFREYSMEEAGALLCVTKQTVRSRLFRARKQLEAAMRPAECAIC